MMRNLVIVLLLASIAGCTGGGETVVSGFANSGNFFGSDKDSMILARAMAQDPNVPEVSQQDLVTAYENLRVAALEGDIPSSIVLYRLARAQRRAREEAQEG